MSKKQARPFGFRDKLGYLFGDFGNDFTFIFASSFLMKFYTDVMGVDAWVIGIIMGGARVMDAFTDLTMGRIADRGKNTPHGKFKPWLLRMCIPVAVLSFLMYQTVTLNQSVGVRITYLVVTYLLWGSFCYTAINIPYGSMASAISADPGDRQSLSTFRTMGGMFAGSIIGVVVPLVAYGKNQFGQTVMLGEKVTMIAGVFSVLAVICYLLCYWLTTERVMTNPDETLDQYGVMDLIKMACANRSLVSIIAASIVMLLAQLTMQGMANYVYPNYYGSAQAQSASTLLMMVGMIAAAGVAKPLAGRYGKAELSVVSNLFAVLVNAVLYFMRPESVWVYAGMQCLSWFGLGVFSMVSWALITDVIDDAELRNGVRQDGTIYAIYSWARKLGQAASSGLVGALLTMIGYTTETAFDPAVTEGIFDISVLVPVIGFGALAAILWFWYPLHKQQVDANVEELNRRHGRS